MLKRSPYEILGLSGDFAYKDIKKAYREGVKLNPPEKEPEKFQELSDAYDALTNDEYFYNNARSSSYYLDIDKEKVLKKSKTNDIDVGKYLREVFEVPFKI